MKKLIKRIKCPECGAEFKGFWVNPICTCGHQIRDLTDNETFFTTLDDGTNTIDLANTVQKKRNIVRNAEQSEVPSKTYNSMLLFISWVMDVIIISKVATSRFDGNYIEAIKWCFNPGGGVYCVVAILVQTIIIILFLVWLCRIIRALYFKYLKHKDNKYFASLKK